MICKSDINGEYYDYRFVEDEVVELSRPDMKNVLFVKYEDWCMNYHIINKWKSIRDTMYS